MTNYPENDYRSYLQHHGILGMRWGVRRFQNKDGSLTSKGKQRYNGKSRSKDEEGVTKRKGLTDKQKRAIMIGAGVLGVSLAAYGTYRIAKAGGFDSLLQKAKGAKAGDAGDILNQSLKNVDAAKTSPVLQITEHAKEISQQTGLPLKDKFYSSVEDELRANPGYDRSKEEWKNSCGHACMNWCLRKIGLDTEALPMKFDETGGLSFGELKAYIKNTGTGSRASEKFDIAKSVVGRKTSEAYKQAFQDKILESCNRQNGAFGIIKSDYLDGPNHFFAFEINDGKVRFLNPQNPVVSTDRYFKEMEFGLRDTSVEFMRFDDKQFDPKKVKEFAKAYSH